MIGPLLWIVLVLIVGLSLVLIVNEIHLRHQRRQAIGRMRRRTQGDLNWPPRGQRRL